MVTRALSLAVLASAAMQLDTLVDYAPGEYLVTSVPLSETILSTLYVWGSQRVEAERVKHHLHGIGWQYCA